LALLDLRRHDAAIADFDQALKIAATDYESLVSRGISRLALGKTDDALEDFSRAIEVEPDDAFAYQWRGDAALAKEKYADAAMDYDSLLRLSPGDPAVALRAGQVRFILGDFERGAEIVAAALRRAPDNADLATWHYAALVRAGKDGRVALEASYAAFQAGGWRQAVADMVLERRTFADALRAAEADQRSAKARLEEVHFVRAIQRLAAGAAGEAVEQFRAVGNLGLTGSSYYRAAKAELGRLAR
jgi:tetratricopeptide (TPR) repeat protein